MEIEENDILLKSKLENVFIQKETVSDQGLQPHELAALITSASAMAFVCGKCDRLSTTDTLLDLYEATDQKNVTELIGMSPQFVKAAIGYSVDFNDDSRARYAYQTNQQEYDDLYQSINQRIWENRDKLGL